ncbi:MAG: response regulator transcription factor [Candidatus Hydrogenedentota bacterium]
MQKVLIVDDDPEVLCAVEDALSDSGIFVCTATDGQSALTSAKDNAPDLVVLDIDLPRGMSESGERLDGVGVLKHLRRVSDIGVLMLTATDLTSMKILALESGADDYLTKPFDPGELLARVQSILRRKQLTQKEEGVITFGELDVHVGARKVFLTKKEVELTRIEFDLLLTMVRRPGQAFTRLQLVENVWDNISEDDRLVDTHISRLRKKIELDPSRPQLVTTVRGIGYRLEKHRD